MRLGAYPCRLEEGTLAIEAYGKKLIYERHRHRYEFNNVYLDALRKTGMITSGVSPDKELVEINVRRTVFYPDKPGRNFITVRGFVMRHAATPWAPPTAEQIGLIGTHWSKGWVIEGNTISHSVIPRIVVYQHTIVPLVRHVETPLRVESHIYRRRRLGDRKLFHILSAEG